MNDGFEPLTFVDGAHTALNDDILQAALSKVQSGFVKNRAHAISQVDDFNALKHRAKASRQRAIKNLADYLELFERHVTARGGHVHWAKTPEQMRQIVLDICKQQNAQYITKGKSMVSEEVQLNQAHLHRLDETQKPMEVRHIAELLAGHLDSPPMNGGKA